MKYIYIEIAERNHVVAQAVAGDKTKTKYKQLASCRSKWQAEKLVEVLNSEANK